MRFIPGLVVVLLALVVFIARRILSSDIGLETLVDPTAELALLITLFIGGRRSILGAVIGALVIQYLQGQGAWNWVSVNILVVEGLLLTVVLLADPDGLAGIAASAAARLGGLRRVRATLQADERPVDTAIGVATGRPYGASPDGRRRRGAAGQGPGPLRRRGHHGASPAGAVLPGGQPDVWPSCTSCST